MVFQVVTPISTDCNHQFWSEHRSSVPLQEYCCSPQISDPVWSPNKRHTLGLVNRPNDISLSRANQPQAKFKNAVGKNLLQSWVNLTIVKLFKTVVRGNMISPMQLTSFLTYCWVVAAVTQQIGKESWFLASLF